MWNCVSTGVRQGCITGLDTTKFKTSRIRILGLEFRVNGLGFMVQGFKVQGCEILPLERRLKWKPKTQSNMKPGRYRVVTVQFGKIQFLI